MSIVVAVNAVAASVLFLFVVRKKALEWNSHLSDAPVAKVQGKSVKYGFVEGEDRGSNPMKPPKMLFDPYYWLRDDNRKDPEVINHLKKENAYFEKHTAYLKPLASELYDDFLSRIKETDSSVPYPFGPFEYYSRTIEKSSYLIYCRRDRGSSGFETEKVVLNMNEIAKGKKFCFLGSIIPSPDHSIICYTLDESGYESFAVYFKDLKTGNLISSDGLPKMQGSISWGVDSGTIFYLTHDAAHRPDKFWRHEMGTSANEDQLLYTENDLEFSLNFDKSASGRYIFCCTSNSVSSEVHFLDLRDPAGSPLKCFEPRAEDIRYSIDHFGEYFYIVTNIDGAKNQKLMKTPITSTRKHNWHDVCPYDLNVTIDEITCFSKRIVIEGRQDGLTFFGILDPRTENLKILEGFPEPTYAVCVGINKEFDASSLRIVYESMVTPTTTFDVNLETLDRTEVYTKPVPNYDRTQYVTERLFAPGHDGVLIPILMGYKKGSNFDRSSQNTKAIGKRKPGPLYLIGYGSYGVCYDPAFSFIYASLVDRGVAVAYAQVRGGGEMGRTWYEDQGKLLKKKNTFEDFISCAKFLINEGHTDKSMLGIGGRSAGGLLMGCVLNLAPHLFKCALCGVPFVDVCTTMSDSSIPLTTGEWQEWGNPNEKKYHEYMLSYDPYQNVTAQDYPAMMVKSGLHDSRVAYWEPAKWVARLRERKTDSNILLLKTELETGHFSASDRYKHWREKSMEYAFLLDQINSKTLI